MSLPNALKLSFGNYQQLLFLYEIQYSRSKIDLESGTYQSYYRGFSLVPATVVVPPETVTAVEGSNVTLPCTADGYPIPHVTWIAPNGTVLQNRTRDTNLTLQNVSRHSSGTYQCNATNELGSDSATVKLDVLCKCFCSFLGFRRNGSIHFRKSIAHIGLCFVLHACFFCMLLIFISVLISFADFLGVVAGIVGVAVAVAVQCQCCCY